MLKEHICLVNCSYLIVIVFALYCFDLISALLEEALPLKKEAPGSDDRAGTVDDDDSGLDKRHSSIGKSKHLFGGGMGFGNLINAGILAEKKLKKVHRDEKKYKHEEKNAFTDVGKSEVTGKPKTNLVRQDFLSLHWTKPKIISK